MSQNKNKMTEQKQIVLTLLEIKEKGDWDNGTKYYHLVYETFLTCEELEGVEVLINYKNEEMVYGDLTIESIKRVDNQNLFEVLVYFSEPEIFTQNQITIKLNN